MRKKVIRKRKTSVSYKASEPVKVVAPRKVRIPKRLRVASSLPADPRPLRSSAYTVTPSLPADPAPVASTRRGGNLILVGVVTHFLAKINVAIIRLGMNVEVGDKLQLEGDSGSFKQKIHSMQIDRKNVETAGRGQEIGMKVNERVKIGELVYILG